jgi:hypothetical protein
MKKTHNPLQIKQTHHRNSWHYTTDTTDINVVCGATIFNSVIQGMPDTLHCMHSIIRVFPAVPRTEWLTSPPACFNIPRTRFINIRKDVYGDKIIS